MKPSLGIDLGTTNSAVATCSLGEPRIIERATGQRLLPSLVGITEDGRRVVGEEARLLSQISPDMVASATKRFIGQRWTPELAARSRLLYPYTLVAGSGEDVRVKLGAQTLPIVQIAGMLLSELRADAEDLFGTEVRKAVITVPANFTDAQRQATREAAEIAGIEPLRLLNEPTAAAMAYGLSSGFAGTCVVFDLGGGTFDVSVLEVKDGVFEVRATAGDPYFGGDDFDNVLVQWLLSHVQDAPSRERVTHDRLAVQHLKQLAERAKREVSTAELSRISAVLLPDTRGRGIVLESMLTRTFFEKLVRPKTEHALAIVEKALLEANVSASDIDTVLLVGGMTRVPLLRSLVSKHFGKEPDSRVDPDEAVALGAAVHAAELVEKKGKTLLLDVVGASLGVQIAGGLVKPLLLRNTMLPCHATEVFYPGHDGQTVVRVPVLQGDGKRAEENTRLGEVKLGNLLGTLRKEHAIEVTFAMDTEGMLSVSAVDRLSGQSEVVKVDARMDLPKKEADALAAQEEAHRAEQLSVDAQERRKNRHARRALHGALVSVRKVHREMQVLAADPEQTDAKQLADQLATAIVDAEVTESSGTLEDVEATTQRLLQMIAN
ncbi:MAG: Hsp70 family protein [Archangium sp.]|nr:Hsp70 family protein [Archangium sp.]MDP3154704.1 Hsp70 family protein [Archangium sp.]MDP3573594.1 Hsp70 family protein [Archangium sp.]